MVWKAMLGERLQKQERIPPIMLLFARLCSADLLGMADAAFDPQLFHQFQEPLHRASRFDPYQNQTRQCGIKLPHGLALMFEGLFFQLSCVAIQRRDRLLSSV